MAEAPVVLLSGHAPHGQLGMGAFQEMRQADMAAPVCKAAWTCAPARPTLAGDLARAFALARSGRPGPVHLSLPSDVLELEAPTEIPSADHFMPVPMPLAAEKAPNCWLYCSARSGR
jgi:acetolactate synthase-1/2/3 large subunit